MEHPKPSFEQLQQYYISNNKYFTELAEYYKQYDKQFYDAYFLRIIERNQPGYVPPVKKKSSNAKAIIILIFIFGSIFLCVLVYNVSKDNKTVTHEKTSSTTTVTYEVTGSSGDVDITYENGTGGTEQLNKMSTPWKRSITFTSNFAYISAQNQRSTGSVTVRIFVNDKLFKESSSDGAYVIASASGSIY